MQVLNLVFFLHWGHKNQKPKKSILNRNLRCLYGSMKRLPRVLLSHFHSLLRIVGERLKEATLKNAFWWVRSIFCSQEKTKNFQKYFPSKRQSFAKNILKKGKVSQEVFPKKGKVLQKVFFNILVLWRKIQIVSSCLSSMEKRGLQVQDICIGSKMHNNSRFESCALRYSLATANRSSGKEELGRACWGGRLISAPLRHGFCWSEQLQKPEDSPIYYEQRRSLCQVRTKYKCKLVIIIYPGPTSTQPWLRALKEARI